MVNSVVLVVFVCLVFCEQHVFGMVRLRQAFCLSRCRDLRLKVEHPLRLSHHKVQRRPPTPKLVVETHEHDTNKFYPQRLPCKGMLCHLQHFLHHQQMKHVNPAYVGLIAAISSGAGKC